MKENINTAAAKAKTAKHSASPSRAPNYEIPTFGLPEMEVPEDFRQMAEKAAAHARDTCAKAKVASEEASDLLENTYTAVTKSVTDYNLKLIEIARTNTRSAFDYAHELLGVTSPSEFIELSTMQIRQQFEIASAQNKELCALAQETATKATGPIKAGVSKAFNKVT
jgi:phasin